MGVTTPSVYSLVAQKAHRLTGGSTTRQFRVLAELQSALALLVRMSTNGILPHAQAERLVLSLFNVPLDGERYGSALIAWLNQGAQVP